MNGDSGCVFDDAGNPLPGQNHFTAWTIKGDTVTADLYNDLGDKVYSRTMHSVQWPQDLVATSPRANAVNVPIDTVISATFSSAPAPDKTSLTVVSSSHVPVAGSLAFNGNTVTFTPSNVLCNGETYTPRCRAR